MDTKESGLLPWKIRKIILLAYRIHVDPKLTYLHCCVICDSICVQKEIQHILRTMYADVCIAMNCMKKIFNIYADFENYCSSLELWEKYIVSDPVILHVLIRWTIQHDVCVCRHTCLS
jgi:hypothetical protein